jgi:hypothetical protein
LNVQKLGSTGKPSGDPFNKPVDEDNVGTPLEANNYTVGLPSGDYEIEVSPDGGSKWLKSSIKATVK